MNQATTTSTHCCASEHPDHNTEIARLNRLGGQVEGVKKMINDRRYCPDIITQLRAIESAAKSIQSNILQRHLQACVQDSFEADNPEDAAQKIAELMALYKRYD